MPRVVAFIITILSLTSVVLAQSNTLEAGDPPVVSLITVSAPDENSQVTISGATGAVFPAAQVAIRNLYTGQTVYTSAGITGQFSATLEGRGNTPFWISPASEFPLEVRTETGSVPGGPGVILYAPFPETQPTSTNPVTQLVVDGQPDDWDAYPNTTLATDIEALRNLESIYLRLGGAPLAFDRVRLELTVNDTAYRLDFNPRQNVAATWQELGTVERDLGAIGLVAATGDGFIEARIPLVPIREQLATGTEETVSLVSVAYLDAELNILQSRDYGGMINLVNEQNGVVYLTSSLPNDVVRFSIAGSVAQGSASWDARGRFSTMMLAPGESFQAEFDVQLRAPDLSPSMVGIEMLGRLSLQPVALEDGFVTSAAAYANNGWSTFKTPSGLPVSFLETTIPLGEVRVSPPQVIRRGDTLLFGMAFDEAVPDDLPAGLYVPVFEGFGQVGDGDIFRWQANGLLGEGARAVQPSLTRLPVPLHIGRDQEDPVRLLWTLFHATPSDGSLGVIPLEDRTQAGLANSVRFNSPTYVLPPGETAPLEPYLINMLPNTYDLTTAPLLPLLFPNGRMNVSIQLPDGQTNALGNVSVLQNVISTSVLDESTRFGTQAAPLDVYRLSTLNEALTSPVLDQYGEYTVRLSGFVEDVWGARYEGGGTYPFVVAELLDMSPTVLPGTPFEAGDALHLGLNVSPGVAATVSVTARLYPLDGSDVIEQQLTGTANAAGLFAPAEPLQLDVPGEYVVDYEARYTDAEGRLWAGSLRSAGVVADPASGLVAHGQRGVANPTDVNPVAWFYAEVAGRTDSEEARAYAPYHNGDIAWVADTGNSGIQPALSLQDTVGSLAAWLQETHPSYTAPDSTPMAALDLQDRLPVMLMGASPIETAQLALAPAEATQNAYTYLSYVTPAVSVRQGVLGAPAASQDLFWDMDDPLLEQIGAGGAGMRPGDYAFLFGGAVVRNPVAELQTATVYGAMATVIDPDDALGGRVFPPYRGAAGGPDGGPLLTLDNTSQDIFFLPTSIRPGDVLTVGDRLELAGQVGPPLASDVAVAIRSPSDEVFAYEGQANTVGHFFQPGQGVTVDEPGVWTVEVTVSHQGASSAGESIQPPLPTSTKRYNVYVVPAENPRLAWGQRTDIPFPVGRYNFTFDIPDGWTEAEGYLTVTLPGAVVRDGELPVQGTAIRYQLDPVALNGRFPNYEGQNASFSGPASSDPVRLTFVFTGTNADGEFDVLARQVVIRHDRLITIE